MGRYEKKPTKRINWSQTVADGLVSLIVGLILVALERMLK